MCISCKNDTPLDRLYMTIDMVELVVHGAVEAMAKGEAFVIDGLLCANLCLREAAFEVVGWKPETEKESIQLSEEKSV